MKTFSSVLDTSRASRGEVISDQEKTAIPEPDDESLLTPEDVARKFQVPISWVYGSIRGRSKDKLPHIYIGRYPRFEETSVREFLGRKRASYPGPHLNSEDPWALPFLAGENPRTL